VHPVKQLQQLLNKKVIVTGTVVRNEGSSIYLATERGGQVVSRTDTDVTVYREGEIVRFANGQVIGKLRSPKKIYVR
jgi:hypothetical protein